MKDRATKLPKMNCRNWECGVVVPIPAPRTALGVHQDQAMTRPVLGMDIFDSYVPVPMKVPGEEYGSKRPWFFQEG